MQMRLSVIIPVLNEAANLASLRQQIRMLDEAGCEVIVADGESNDDSRDLASVKNVRWISAGPGRASQMNAGAELAGGEVLLFLHADTQLPARAVQDIVLALSRPGICWGRFDVVISGRSRMLPVIAAMMNWRSRMSGIATGDQAIFVQRDVFTRIGGFPLQPLMEDIALSARLRKLSRPACLRAKVRTSGRRWDTNGVWRTMLLMWRLRLLYWLGTPVEKLARAYRR